MTALKQQGTFPYTVSITESTGAALMWPDTDKGRKGLQNTLCTALRRGLEVKIIKADRARCKTFAMVTAPCKLEDMMRGVNNTLCITTANGTKFDMVFMPRRVKDELDVAKDKDRRQYFNRQVRKDQKERQKQDKAHVDLTEDKEEEQESSQDNMFHNWFDDNQETSPTVMEIDQQGPISPLLPMNQLDIGPSALGQMLIQDGLPPGEHGTHGQVVLRQQVGLQIQRGVGQRPLQPAGGQQATAAGQGRSNEQGDKSPVAKRPRNNDSLVQAKKAWEEERRKLTDQNALREEVARLAQEEREEEEAKEREEEEEAARIEKDRQNVLKQRERMKEALLQEQRMLRHAEKEKQKKLHALRKSGPTTQNVVSMLASAAAKQRGINVTDTGDVSQIISPAEETISSSHTAGSDASSSNNSVLSNSSTSSSSASSSSGTQGTNSASNSNSPSPSSNNTTPTEDAAAKAQATTKEAASPPRQAA